MTLWGRVRFAVGKKQAQATLGPSGWKCPGFRLYADILNAIHPCRHSPSAGDPVAASIQGAAKTLGGTVDYIRPVEEHPDRVY